MPTEEEVAVHQFLHAFNFTDKVDADSVRKALFSQRQLNDLNGSRDYVDQFIKKCERRDANTVKHLKKRVYAIMSESEQMTLMMDFLVRCRQAHLFHIPSNGGTGGSMASGSSTTTPSVQSSPFQRRPHSRTRAPSSLTPLAAAARDSSLVNESSRSRANSSFTSYDSRVIGVERQTISDNHRAKSPFRISSNGGDPMVPTVATNRVSPLTASNHLFSPSNAYSSMITTATTQSPYRRAADEPYVFQHRATPTSHLNSNGASTGFSTPSSTVTALRTASSATRTPLHSRIGSAMTHPESHVCECLLKALLGIETQLFTSIHRKMAITSTASLSTSHTAVAQRVLPVANLYLLLSHKEPSPLPGTVSSALLAAIRLLLGDYTADVDGLRRLKNLKFHKIVPLIDKWHNHLSLLAKAHRHRNIGDLELLETLYVLHRSYSLDDGRQAVLDKVLEYTMGVFCQQMMDWMTNGEVPDEKWIIRKDAQTGDLFIKKVPIFMSEMDAKILLEIGKSLPRVESASDEDLTAIDKATTQVRAALTPTVIFRKELTPLLGILRDVVCGIVMRMVLTTGRLKEHVHKATSFFFLTDPRFTITLYTIIKDASMGLRVGSASLTRQQVSSALASALEATTVQTAEERKKNKLKFTLDALTTLGNTPNVSSRMQFVQPLRPKYEPSMELMKPIFHVADNDYEAIFHVIWAIDLARLSSQESAAHLPPMIRFLLKAYSLRENAWSLLDTLSHVFFVINSALSRVRGIISMQVAYQLSRFLAAIDDKCLDMDDVILEHRKFVRRVSVVTFVRNNEQIEQELSNLLRVSFEAQEFCDELTRTWYEILENTQDDENIRKARVAECCQKRVLGVRMLLETVNKSQKKLTELLDHQIAFGNEALID